MTESLGILGGMGPLTSAEFLKTIYEVNISGPEQDAPACVLYSDPSVPDRTEAILSGSEDQMLDRLTEALENLSQLNAGKIVVACVTSHHLFPRLPLHLSAKLLSLVDLIISEVLSRQKKSLLLCSNGTRKKRLFEQHPLWIEANEFIVVPSEDDQMAIHGLIYHLKRNGSTFDAIQSVFALLQRYQLNSFIAACTEFHLLTKHLLRDEMQRHKYEVIDPLLTLARNIKSWS
jgi:aspartate racemase